MPMVIHVHLLPEIWRKTKKFEFFKENQKKTYDWLKQRITWYLLITINENMPQTIIAIIIDQNQTISSKCFQSGVGEKTIRKNKKYLVGEHPDKMVPKQMTGSCLDR